MKKLLNPLVTAIIGMFVGGLIMYGYYSKVKVVNISSSNSLSDTLLGEKSATRPSHAKAMIDSLYKFIIQAKTPIEVRELFQKSYSLSIDDIKQIALVKGDLGDTLGVKARIYPALRTYKGKKILSFIFMVEKNGSMQWDSLKPNDEQTLIQDQWAPCPTECPGGGGGIDKGNDLFTEANWVKVMNGTYKKK